MEPRWASCPSTYILGGPHGAQAESPHHTAGLWDARWPALLKRWTDVWSCPPTRANLSTPSPFPSPRPPGSWGCTWACSPISGMGWGVNLSQTHSRNKRLQGLLHGGWVEALQVACVPSPSRSWSPTSPLQDPPRLQPWGAEVHMWMPTGGQAAEATHTVP